MKSFLGFKWVHSHKPSLNKQGKYLMTERRLLLMHKWFDYLVFHEKKLPDLVQDY